MDRPLEGRGPPRRLRQADGSTARAGRAAGGPRGGEDVWQRPLVPGEGRVCRNAWRRRPGPPRTEPGGGSRPGAGTRISWWSDSPRWPEGPVCPCREPHVGEPRPRANGRHHLDSRVRDKLGRPQFEPRDSQTPDPQIQGEWRPATATGQRKLLEESVTQRQRIRTRANSSRKGSGQRQGGGGVTPSW